MHRDHESARGCKTNGTFTAPAVPAAGESVAPVEAAALFLTSHGEKKPEENARSRQCDGV